jgi:hypothetical protein
MMNQQVSGIPFAEARRRVTMSFPTTMWGTVLLAAASTLPASSWTAQTRVNYVYVPGTTIAGVPVVAVSPVNGRVYVASQAGWNASNGNDMIIGFDRGIIRGRSIDWSYTATHAIEASPRGHKCLAPAIAVGSLNGQEIIHLTYWDHIGSEDVLYVRSTDGGDSWSTPVNLSNTGTASQSSLAADDQGNVFVIWTDWYGNAGGNNLDIYLRKGTCNGSNTVWQAARKIENNPNTKSLYPKIFREPAGKLHFIWADRLVLPPKLTYTYSVDGGNTVAPLQTVFTGDPNNDMQGAAVAVDAAGTVYAAAQCPPAYGNTGPTHLYLCTRTPGGDWSVPSIVDGSDPCANPYMTADNAGHVFLSWLRYTNGQYDIIVRQHGPLGWYCNSNATNDGLWKGYTGGNVIVDPVNGFLHVVTDNTPDGTHQIYATTLDLRAGPPPVTDAASSASDAQIVLNWRNPVEPDMSAVHIVYRTDRYPTAPTGEAGTLPAGEAPAVCGTSGTFTHTGLTNYVTYYYALYNRDDYGNYASPVLISAHTPGQIPGDLDHDDDVDQADFGLLQPCLSGSFIAQPDPACRLALMDIDNDVDQYDVDLFIGCMSGPEVQAELYCAD